MGRRTLPQPDRPKDIRRVRGLAKYFNIDPTIVRIVAVASLFVGTLVSGYISSWQS